MKSYLITVKGNDTFIYDCEITAKDFAELVEKCCKLLENLGKQTIEQLYIDSIYPEAEEMMCQHKHSIENCIQFLVKNTTADEDRLREVIGENEPS